jgi:hypothetical protein
MPITASGLPEAALNASEATLTAPSLLPEKWFSPPHVCTDIYGMYLETREIELETVPPGRLVQDTPGVVVSIHLLRKIVGVIGPAKIRLFQFEFLWKTRVYQ